MLRKCNVEVLWRRYQSENPLSADGTSPIFGRSHFTRLARMMTRSERKRKSSIDYMLGALVYDNSIMEAVFRRVRKEIPTMKDIWVQTDNARNYQNEIVPVMAPFVAHDHGMVLRGSLHPETARGKSLVDAHFAVGMRQVNKYVTSNGVDVATPVDVVKALTACGGVANSAAELVYVNRHGNGFKPWRENRERGHKKMRMLGRVGEVFFCIT